MLASRQMQERRLGGIVIDDKVEREPVVGLCEAMQREMLDPNTGMEEIGLMTGKQPRLIERRGRGERFTGLSKVAARSGPGFGAGPEAQLRQRLVQDPDTSGKEFAAIMSQERGNLCQRRLGENTAVFPRGAQARRSHRHLPGAADPQHSKGRVLAGCRSATASAITRR